MPPLWAPLVQIGATALAGYGSFQAARDTSKKKNIFSRTGDWLVQKVPETSFAGKLVRDNEFNGVAKLLMENVPMLIAAHAMGAGNLLHSYMYWMAGNVVGMGRRVVKMFRDDKHDLLGPVPKDRFKSAVIKDTI